MRLGIDIGGTFTDLLLVDDETGGVRIVKVLTTPADPSRGVVEAVDRALAEPNRALSEVSVLVHGTTLITNTIIERKGARTALLATEGHRDAVEIRREHRYEMYDVLVEMPKPLVPRHLRFGIDERISPQGEVLRPLDREQVERLVRRLQERGIEAIGVSFLHSYRNPVHELAVKEIVARVAPDLYVSLSSQVAPEIKEFERTSTTLCNAYVQARVEEYLGRLEDDLRERTFDGSFFLMQSSGGLCSTETARNFPVRVLESGPAGGALAASHFGQALGLNSLLSFDMGGTTAKLAVIDDGQPLVAPEFEVDRVYRFTLGSGLPVRVPTVEMIEIGAGGGSIARLDALSLIRVGPESAGAAPGPACYGQGGELPTVTDADLLLGYLDPDYFLGGRMSLDTKRAREAVARHIADPLGLDVIEAASGIHRIVNENMASAARVHLTERGKNAADYPLFAFGGAGPVHAYGVAAAVGAPGIVVPFGAGVMSALGFLTAPLSFEFVQSWYGLLGRLDWAQVGGFLQKMEREGRELLQKAGVPGSAIGVERWCDIRYHGQGFDVKILLPDGALGEDSVAEIRRRFEERYRELYGRTIPGVEFEAVNWRVIVQGPKPDLSIAPSVAEGASVDAARKSARQAYFAEAGGFVETPVFDRYRLAPGAILTGPAIVEEHEATTIIGPGASATIDRMLNLVIHL
ncbi:MAG: hydantoinase/oxoprolinase family protein [Ardenticatenaceae bacterium]|nr:hydantoinase/oxoprolinase family protein [Ardenticatenaceae bacterium]